MPSKQGEEESKFIFFVQSGIQFSWFKAKDFADHFNNSILAKNKTKQRKKKGQTTTRKTNKNNTTFQRRTKYTQESIFMHVFKLVLSFLCNHQHLPTPWHVTTSDTASLVITFWLVAALGDKAAQEGDSTWNMPWGLPKFLNVFFSRRKSVTLSSSCGQQPPCPTLGCYPDLHKMHAKAR